ncbi:hypothetical protein [Risungbinella massiliensis]|uniref:hypothetical protein n=1 Tax=Risungbinella massiliensis TaxID=1329796 RepID=UPI0005CBF750|nr:hypothetical protein [Risungbinella massiliensis]
MVWLEDEKRFMNRKERQERIELLDKYIEKIKVEHGVLELLELDEERLLDVLPCTLSWIIFASHEIWFFYIANSGIFKIG